MFNSVGKFWRGTVDRLQDAFRDGTRQRITTLGLGFICFIVVVGAAAFVSGNNLLFLLFAALLATFLISGFVSRLGLAGLELELHVPPHITARRDLPARVVVRNRKWLVPSFSLQLSGDVQTGLTRELAIAMIPGGRSLEHAVMLHFERRGIYRNHGFYFASRFPFGFTHRRAEVQLKRELLVYPSIEPQAGFETLLDVITGDVESRQRGLGTDFYRVRPYTMLESARHVDWRATAHTGDLQIREFVQEQNRSVAVLLDCNVPDDAFGWFETAVECAAFLVTRLTGKAVAIHFVAGVYERRIPGNADVYDILKFLASVQPFSGTRPAPLDENSVQVALTACPDTLASFGLDSARVLSLAELEPARAARHDRAGQTGAGEDLDNNNGAGASGNSGLHHNIKQNPDSGAAGRKR